MAKTKSGKFEYSGGDLQKQFQEATQRAAKADLREPRAMNAYYDKQAKHVVVTMTNGVVVSIPSERLQGLAAASPDDLAKVEVSVHGTSLHWKKLDADFSVPGLLAGIFGTRTWMAELGRKGGGVISEAKAVAARTNGQKGGRPRQKEATSLLPTKTQQGPPPTGPTKAGAGSRSS